jgi:hypothetical protein
MKTVAVVAWREIVEHRVFLLAALAALVVTLVVPLVPANLGWSGSDVREALTLVMALGFTALSAIFLGASTVTGTVAAGRFGFFLARPAGAAAIWFGKLLGVLAVVLACLLIVAAPALLVPGVANVLDDGLDWVDLTLGPLAFGTTAVGLALMVCLFAHAVATVWRGGTAWAAVDLIAFAVAIAGAWISVVPLLRAGAEDAATVVALVLVAVVAIAPTVGGALQIGHGGDDGRRQHRVFSSVMWSLLLPVCVASAAYSAWLLRPSAEDLIGCYQLAVQPAGSWVAVSGPTAGRLDVEGTFAIDLDSGTSFRLGLGPSWMTSAAFSADGRVAVWSVRDGEAWRIRHADLSALPDSTAGSQILLNSNPCLVLSPAGDRLATIEDDSLVITELASGDLVGAARIPYPGFYRYSLDAYFADRERVRVLIADDVSGESLVVLRGLEFDSARRTLAETGTLAATGAWFQATIDSARDRLLLRAESDGEPRFWYLDARTLEAVDWTANRELGGKVRMLADGSLIRLAEEGEEGWLERLTPDGEIRARVRLPDRAHHLVIGAQPTASTVYVAWSSRQEEDIRWEDFQLLLVDLETGKLREIGRGMPVRYWSWDGVMPPLPAGSPAARLFFGESDSLLLWDPATDRIEPVVRGRG